jgi:hypothetical protein
MYSCEHAIKPVDQHTDFILGCANGSDGVIAVCRYPADDVRQLQNRAADDTLHARGDDIHNKEGSYEDQGDDKGESALPFLLFAEIRPQEDRALVIVHGDRVI